MASPVKGLQGSSSLLPGHYSNQQPCQYYPTAPLLEATHCQTRIFCNTENPLQDGG